MPCFRLPREKSENRIDGYREVRRSVLICTPAAMLTSLSSPSRLLAAINNETDGDEISRFLRDTAEEAVRLKTDDSPAGQNAYVDYLARSASPVRAVEDVGISTKSWKGMDPGVFLGTAGRNQAFFIVHWKLAPHALLPAHCHPKTSVCTLGIEGESLLRHFQPDQDAPSYRNDRESLFRIEETRQVELRAGEISTLTEFRDNIHLFQAGRHGARGIDVTTDYGGDGSFSFLDFDHRQPVDKGSSSYVARWTGTTPPLV